MVEFAFVAPLAFLLLLGVIVTAMVVTNQVALTNAVRNGARAAAVCGSDPTATTTLPDGTSCTGSNGLDAAVTAYVKNQLHSIQATATLQSLTVTTAPSPGGLQMAYCVKGATVTVRASFAQPLYVPLLGRLLGDGGSDTRNINAQASATCEQ